jgi:hypothetical protein
MIIKELLFERSSNSYVAQRLHNCPDDVDVYNVESYLIQNLGKPLDVAVTEGATTKRTVIGWTFEPPAEMELPGPRDDYEIAAIPMIETEDGGFTSALLVVAQQRAAFEAVSRESDVPLTVVDGHSEYRADKSAAPEDNPTSTDE